MYVLTRRDCKGLNLYAEGNRLSESHLARWSGPPVCWVDARPIAVARSVVNVRPVLALLDAGEAQAEIDYPLRKVRLDLSSGAMGLFLPAETRASRWYSVKARRIMVDLDPAALAAVDPDLDATPPMALRQNLEFRDVQVATLLRAMVREIELGCPHGRLFAQTASLKLLARLRDRLGTADASHRERGRLTRTQMARIDEFIDLELADDLSLGTLASLVGFSVPQFVRLFRNAAGCSPHRYVVRKRLERAVELLQHTDMPLPALALAAGFSSQSHMNGSIRTVLGVTPGEVRHQASVQAQSALA